MRSSLSKKDQRFPYRQDEQRIPACRTDLGRFTKSPFFDTIFPSPSTGFPHRRLTADSKNRIKMSQSVIDRDTILKYDVQGPRYTSYPTAPEWTSEVTDAVYREKLKSFGKSNKTLSLYIHIPFCRSLCYFCACNVIIRKNEDKYGDEYLDFLEKEIDLAEKYIGPRKKIKQFHLGGGTPTFLTEAQLTRLFKKVSRSFDIDFDGEVAIEIDPRTIDHSKMKKLKTLGFNRVSMGIQDFDENVQKEVNRIQPFECVRQFFDWCRELKFLSINCDLIYGLPNQKPHDFARTIDKIIELRPDRIALYNLDRKSTR